MTGSRRLNLTGLACALLAAAPVAAQSPQKPADPCFLANDVNGFHAPNDRTLYVRVGINDIYRLDLMTDCISLTFRELFALETTPANPWICSPMDATVIYRQHGIPERCPVQAIHKLSPAELTALPKSDRP